MQIHFQGGFGEKGRLSVCVEGDGTTVMLDAGIKVGAPDADYHPQLALPADEIDAVVITHAHEDHVGALCWLAAQGFSGPIYMTAETLAETPMTLAQYARPADLAAHPLSSLDIQLVEIGQRFEIGKLSIDTGHSGHVAGGMWIAVTGTAGRVMHCGDVVPNSDVFPMTPLPGCDVLLLDASYGADPVSSKDRAVAIAAWIADHSDGALLPTPLSGRSLELIAIQPGPFAIAADMAAPLLAQIDSITGLDPAMFGKLSDRVRSARNWQDTDDFPNMPLLVHDGMGSAGPAATAIPLALARNHPMLFTGHLPAGSPGAMAHADGRADWIRMPTHPTLDENVAMGQSTNVPQVFGHSCPPEGMADLARHIPNLDPTVVIGQTHVLKRKDASCES
ncbi:MBL fold metallo-hydrolase [Oceaniglobus ichthyenteri]|uniref:MBL fold metallo-hydrolase n=1 Tax=Oceaniglobus ichthyenteri TaxID=2136177 RepID=UPI000D34860F|nr:MBL fold metallo-hydrolase [Oceaniglobus ichthyenteri]